MLLGEHLGGREQRRLAPGVDDAQHRAERHDGLAGADLALEQPVHRVTGGQVVEDLLADRALAGGEVEGQPGVEPVEQPALPAGARCAGSAASAARFRARMVCATKASWKRSDVSAAALSCHESGRCRARSAACASSSPRERRTSSGTGSSTESRFSSAILTVPSIFHDDSFLVAG